MREKRIKEKKRKIPKHIDAAAHLISEIFSYVPRSSTVITSTPPTHATDLCVEEEGGCRGGAAVGWMLIEDGLAEERRLS